MKLYFIAGEFSGDFIGYKVIKAIKSKEKNSSEFECFGVGGDLMKSQGIDSLFDFQQINLMGFVEVVPHIMRIKSLIESTVQDVITKKTDLLITIDSPGFTFRVAEKVKKLAPQIKLIHIVAPSVWAYKEGRAKKYAKLYDKLLTLLPFEPPYFTKYGLDSEFIGHPILEQDFPIKDNSFVANDIKQICITPGSRKGEILNHMPIIKSALNLLAKKYQFKAIFIQPNNNYIDDIFKHLQDAEFGFSVSTDRLKIFASSDVALAKSGTNTLEIACCGTPQIIGYKLNSLTFLILRMIIKVKYANLINIIANREIIPELIQTNFNAQNIFHSIDKLLSDKYLAKQQLSKSYSILQKMGFQREILPSEKAARAILDLAYI